MLRESLDGAAAISADEYDAARRTSSRARQVFADTMADYDVILTPSAPGAAPPGLGATGNPMFNRLWTLMGTPCVNVPGLSEDELPLGIQIVGRFGRDRAALEAALFVERAIAAGSRVIRRHSGLPRSGKSGIHIHRSANMDSGFLAEPVIGPATSGRTRWLGPGMTSNYSAALRTRASGS